jgi:hypothetical protein
VQAYLPAVFTYIKPLEKLLLFASLDMDFYYLHLVALLGAVFPSFFA